MKNSIIFKIKRSIGFKMSLCVVGCMLAVMLLGGFFGYYVMQTYYLNTKESSLIEVYDELNNMIKYDENLEQEKNISRLNVYCETKGVSVLLVNSDGTIQYSYGAGAALDKRMAEIIYKSIIFNQNVHEQVLEENSDYSIKIVTDKQMDNQKHLEISGIFTGNKYFVMRVAIENIRESIIISNKFYGFLGGILIVIVTAIMLVITRRYTKPLLKLAHISREMSALNFDVKYEEKRDDEIGVLGDSMNEMSMELQKTISELKSANIELQKDIDKKTQIEKMRNEFLSNVSHELKTPIALIQGYAEGLRDGITDDPESTEFYCDVIIDEAGKMNKMVKNLLTLNQIEFGEQQVQMERFDVVTLIKGVLNNQQIKAKQQGVKVIFDENNPIFVWADEFEIEEVVTNYISNAFNHVKGINVIKVQIHQNDGTVRVSVFNTGDNIPEEDIEHIWEKFYKVDKARTREYGGNGIGLSIVKAIVEKMGKSCGVENRDDGVEFWFELDSKTKE